MRSESSELTSFLPSYWSCSLKGIPVLGSVFAVIDLNTDFTDFLESDGLTLDEEKPFISGFSSSEDYSSEEETCADDIRTCIPSERFPELHERIRSAIQSLGGAVVPKLNWTVPKVNSWELNTPY